MEQQVAIHTAAAVLNTLAKMCGESLDEVARRLAFDASLLAQRDAVVPKAKMDALWTDALRISNDPGFGLAVAAQLELSQLGVIGHLMRTSATLSAAFGQAVRFQQLLQHGSSNFRTVQSKDSVRYEFSLLPPLASGHVQISEFVLASLIQLGHRLVSSFAPVAVELEHGPQVSLSRYLETMRCQPVFRAERGAVVISRRSAELSVATADVGLYAIVEEHAIRRIEASHATEVDSSLENRVRGLLARGMGRGDVLLGGVAQQLALSERTLRRRLEAEGVSFQRVLDDVRFSAAKSYLAQDGLSTLEIALLLGFSDATAFYRAFRRWAGCSVRDYRAREPGTENP